MTREFLIQRYCWDNRPRVQGLRPFIATGPRFMEWAVKGSLERFGEWRFRPGLYQTIAGAFPLLEDKEPGDREAIATVLLDDGVVRALWSVDSAQCLPADLRRQVSIREVSEEIPYVKPGSVRGPYDLAFWTLEFLSGLSGPEHFRDYVSPDHLALEELAPS